MAKISELNASYNPVDVDTRPGNYYVSVVDAGRVGLLLGPFDNHPDALANVDRCRDYAQEINRQSFFYGFGTVRFDDYSKPGLFNNLIGM